MAPKIIVEQFLGSVEILSITPIENGLINHTFLVETESGKFILQQINTLIFKNPNAIQNNHLKINYVLEQSEYSRKTVKLIPTLSQDLLFEKNNEAWRMLEYLEDSVTFLKPSSTEIAFEATKCLSEFYKIINQEQIILEETLSDFINFEKRVIDFKTALIQETERKKTAENEINFILEHLSLPNRWVELEQQDLLPLRVIHADPKISNILFDKDNKDGLTSAGYTAAGMLAPFAELETAESIIFDLGVRSVSLWPDLLKEVGVYDGFQLAGTIITAHPQDSKELEHFITTLKNKVKEAKEIESINKEQLEELEPELTQYNKPGLCNRKSA